MQTVNSHSPVDKLRHAPRVCLIHGLQIAVSVTLIGIIFFGAISDRASAGWLLRGNIACPLCEIPEEPHYVVGLYHNDVLYEMTNSAINPTMYWIAVRKNDPSYVINDATDWSSDGNPIVISPTTGVDSNLLFIRGDLGDLQKYYYLINVKTPAGALGNLHNFLANSTVYAGFGPLTGNPTTVEQAIAATDGMVLYGDYPETLTQLDEGWVLHSVGQAPNVVQGIIEPGSQVNEQAEHAVSLLNNQLLYEIINADGTSNSTLHWIGVRKNDPSYVVNYALDQGSDVPTQIFAPENGVNSDYLLLSGDLLELQKYRYGFNVVPSSGGTGEGDMNNFLENSTVYAGFGPLSGTPTTIEDAIAMTQGTVVIGNYPVDGIDHTDEWVLHFTSSTTDPIPGDYDGDRDVDIADFNEWRAAFGTTVTTAGDGADGNHDSVIDAADYIVWRKNLISGSGTGAGSTQVPEPAAWLLTLCAAAIIASAIRAGRLGGQI